MPTVTYHDARHEDLARRDFLHLPRAPRPAQAPPSRYGFDANAPAVTMEVPTLRIRLYRSPLGQGEETGTLLSLGRTALVYRPDDDSPTAQLMGPDRAVWADYADATLDGPRSRVRPNQAWLTHYLRTEQLSRKVLQERQALVADAPDRWLEVADLVAMAPDPLLRLRAFHRPASGPMYSCPLDLPIRLSQLSVVEGPAPDPAFWLLKVKDQAERQLHEESVSAPEVENRPARRVRLR